MPTTDQQLRESGIERRWGVFYRMADILTPGVSGSAAVDTFDIAPDTFQGFRCEHTQPGRYARLMFGQDARREVVMSDTDMEMRTNVDAVKAARGNVMIGGLGIGMVTLPIVLKPNVSHVTVVEQNPDVIALVKPSLERFLWAHASTSKLTVVQGDARTWEPTFTRNAPRRIFDFVYVDIWTDLCVDDVADRQAIHKHYRRFLRTGGTVTSWEYEHLYRLKRAGRWR